MSGGYKFMNRLGTLLKGGAVLSAAAVTALTATGGVSKSKTVDNGKDKVVFISKEENSIPPKVRIPVRHGLSENRDKVLPNGEVNMACQCIEHDVVGPCNLEFRKLRVYMHNNEVEDISTMPKEVSDELDKLFESYIICTMDHPVYYRSNMIEEEIEDMERQKKQQEKIEREKRLAREANTRNFGKDTVVFLTKEEASSQCSVVVPQVQVEEDRGPLNPDGSLNWGCTCIEKDVVGPCNIEFRKFRLLAEARRSADPEMPFSEDEVDIFTNFMTCLRDNPVYYHDMLKRTQPDSEAVSDTPSPR